MTVERLIAPERALPSHSVQEPRVRSVGQRVVQGGGWNGGDAGHKNHGQTIAHLFERRQEIRTSRYKDVPAGGTVLLKPDDTGGLTLRFAGGVCPVTFALPPAVPEGQGSTRHRQWSVRVRTFYAAETQLNWPANVVPAVGYDLLAPETEGGLQTLEEIGVLPAQPGMPGTSDTFELTYDERTGEWIVDWFSRNRVTLDPATPAPGTTDPTAPGATDGTTPTPPGEPSNPAGPTEQDYTDPVTGDLLVPVVMPAAAGNVIALHNGAVSYSTDGGSVWRKLNGSAAAPVAISAVLSQGVVIVGSDGVAGFSQNLQGWTPIKLATIGGIEVPLVNADFETGDLTGWTISSGTEPRALDTAQPPQRPGSKHYLSRNWTIVSSGAFALDQAVELDANTWAALQDGGTLRLSADAYADSPGTAKIQIIDGTERVYANSTFSIARTGSNFRANGFAVSPTAGPLNLVGTGTPVVGSFINESLPIWLRGNSGQAVSCRIDWRIEKDDGSLFDGLVVIRVFDVDSPETLTVEGIEGYDLLTSSVTATSLDTKTVRFIGGDGAGTTADVPAVRVHVTVGAEFSFLMTGVTQSAVGLAGPGGTSTEVVLAEAEWADSTWKRISAAVPGADMLSPNVRVRLIGAGNISAGSANAYLDNVKLEVSLDRQEEARTVAPDYSFSRHVVASERGLYAVRAGVAAMLSACPIAPEHIAVEGPQIIVASGSDVRVSWNDGQSWTAYTAPGLVRQLFAGTSASLISGGAPTGTVIAVTADGDAIVIGKGEEGFSILHNGPPGAAHVSIDRRRRASVWTAASGSITWVGETGAVDSNQPVSDGSETRRTLPCDSGRLIGYQFAVKDLFYTAEPAGPWALAPSLDAAILDLVEVR